MFFNPAKFLIGILALVVLICFIPWPIALIGVVVFAVLLIAKNSSPF